MEYYEKLLRELKQYFKTCRWKDYFLCGGCYWLANLLQQHIPDSYLVINYEKEHCALFFNNGVYDVTGRISKRGFVEAVDDDIGYMMQEYIPDFNVAKLEKYLQEQGLLGSESDL